MHGLKHSTFESDEYTSSPRLHNPTSAYGKCLVCRYLLVWTMRISAHPICVRQIYLIAQKYPKQTSFSKSETRCEKKLLRQHNRCFCDLRSNIDTPLSMCRDLVGSYTINCNWTKNTKCADWKNVTRDTQTRPQVQTSCFVFASLSYVKRFAYFLSSSDGSGTD